MLRKLGRFEINLMPQVLRLHRIIPGRGQFPNPAEARGLVHFLGVPTPEKLAAMRAYAEALAKYDAQ